jgi:L-malate glycosyltransferase
MKIGITCYPTYGGSGVVATELGIELAQRGHEIHFISYSSAVSPGHELASPTSITTKSTYRIIRSSTILRTTLALATRMAEVAELYGLDLLHVHYAIPHSVSAHCWRRQMLAAKPHKQRLPFVTTLHGTDITLVGLDRSYLPITRFSIEAK